MCWKHLADYTLVLIPEKYLMMQQLHCGKNWLLQEKRMIAHMMASHSEQIALYALIFHHSFVVL